MADSLLQLVVEDGTAKPDANCYCTLAEAEVYMVRIPDTYKAAWVAADDYTKTQGLIWATQVLDGNIIFPGLRTKRTQALNFPRFGVLDQDGYLVFETSVPHFMKDATAQMAFELLKEDKTFEPVRGISHAYVGSLRVVFDLNHANDPRIVPRSVLTIVARFGGQLRGSRRNRSVPLYRT